MLEELKEANEYISSKIDKYRSTYLLIKEIEKDAEINNVPIISKEIREYLKFIIRTNKNIKKFLEERKEFKVEKLYIPKNVLGDYDSLGGFCINYKEEIMDNFYIIKLKKGEKC